MDSKYKILSILPCKIGQDFLDSCVAIGMGNEGNELLNQLITEGSAIFDEVSNSFVPTLKGQEILLDLRKESAKIEVSAESQALTTKVLKEISKEGEVLKIHPALDFNDGRAYTSIFLDFPSEKSSVEKAVVITSAREMIVADELPSNLRLSAVPMKSVASWSKQSVLDFINGKSQEIKIQEIFAKVKNLFDLYIEFFDPHYNTLAALWVLGTYFHQLFNSFPYLYVLGAKATGKTKILNLTYCLSFNPFSMIIPSSSSLYRIINQTHGSLMIDEIEKIQKDYMADIRAVLLSGYKKGSFIPRTEEATFQGKKVHVVESYESYSPKLMANISGMEDVLEDRCIKIVTVRSRDPKRSNRSVNSDDYQKFQPVRDELFLNLMFNWQTVRDSYEWLKKVFLEETEITQDVKETISYIGEKVYGRNLEIWLPIYALAHSISKEVFKEIVDLSISKVEEKLEVDETENQDALVLRALCPLIDETKWYKVSELARDVKLFEDMEWVNSKNLSRSLVRLNIRRGSMVEGGRKMAFINLNTFKNICYRFNIDYEEARKLEPSGLPTSAKDRFLDVVYRLKSFHKEKYFEEMSKEGFDRIKADELLEKAVIEGVLYEVTMDNFEVIAKFESSQKNLKGEVVE
jgi:hypothetical protein